MTHISYFVDDELRVGMDERNFLYVRYVTARSMGEFRFAYENVSYAYSIFRKICTYANVFYVSVTDGLG